MRFRNRNQQLNVEWRRLAARRRLSETLFNAKIKMVGEPSPPTDKRTVIFKAVAEQIEHDHKRPWSLSQKLNDAPYRYTRDTLWAALNRISHTLGNETPRLIFATEDDYAGKDGFSAFVNTCLTGTVSALINALVGASRWAK